MVGNGPVGRVFALFLLFTPFYKKSQRKPASAYFAFVIVEHSSRRVVHIGVTRHPSDARTAQQLREACRSIVMGTARDLTSHPGWIASCA